jgi:hypothetical protein
MAGWIRKLRHEYESEDAEQARYAVYDIWIEELRQELETGQDKQSIEKSIERLDKRRQGRKPRN